tara:strand:- start:2381 stop:2701 length:321 start_codon:yes stop_codon:yes gene_type:complete
MKTIKVTKLQKQVLEALADRMYAEAGFSDTTFNDLREATGLTKSTLTGVIVSLQNADYMYTDEEYVTSDDDIIMYLDGVMFGLVPNWVEECKNSPGAFPLVQLEVK